MRFLKSLFIFLGVLQFQICAEADNNCQAQISNYVIRGNLTATYPGARLWRLDQLKKEAAAKKTCAAEIFERAVSESENYWNHIDSKYHCGNFDSKIKRDAEQCSDSMSDSVLSNKAYLVFINLEKQFKPNCPLQKPNIDVLGKTAGRSLHQTAQALQTVVGKNKCEAIPLKDRMDDSDATSSEAQLANDLSRGLASCLSGLLTGFIKEGLWASLKSIWSTLKDPTGTFLALTEVAKAMATNPAKTIAALGKNVANSIYGSYLAKYENFDCYSSSKKSQIMCSSIGQSAATIVEFFVGASAFKAGVKVTKAATNLIKSSNVVLRTVEAPLTPALTGPTTSRPLLGSPVGTSKVTPGLTRAGEAIGKADLPKASLGKPIDPITPSEPPPASKSQPSSADLKKQDLEAKLRQQSANRDLIEESRIKTLSPSDDLSEIKRKLTLPENSTDADVIKHIKKLRSKYHPDKQFVPEDVSTEISKIILKLKTK